MVLSDGSVLVMGGNAASSAAKNDVWRGNSVCVAGFYAPSLTTGVTSSGVCKSCSNPQIHQSIDKACSVASDTIFKCDPGYAFDVNGGCTLCAIDYRVSGIGQCVQCPAESHIPAGGVSTSSGESN